MSFPDKDNLIATKNGLGARFGGRELVLRVASSVVLIPIVIVISYIGGLVFAVMAWVIGISALWEWALLFGKPIRLAPIYFIILTIGAIINFGGLDWLAFLVVFGGSIGLMAVGGDKDCRGCRHMAIGTMFAAISAIGLVYIRADPVTGFSLAIFTFVVVWGNDVFAYFIGKVIGGYRLVPRISPGKTWSGTIGGVIAAVGVGYGFYYYVTFYGSEFYYDGASKLPIILGLSVTMAVAAVIGDLFESYWKRRFLAKDSGSLIPGHGGMLDRIDGLSGAILVAVIYKLSVSLLLFWSMY